MEKQKASKKEENMKLYLEVEDKNNNPIPIEIVLEKQQALTDLLNAVKDVKYPNLPDYKLQFKIHSKPFNPEWKHQVDQRLKNLEVELEKLKELVK